MTDKIDVLNVSGMNVPGFDGELASSFRVHTKISDANALSIRGLVTSGSDGASADTLKQIPNLEIIANIGVGYDAIDINHAVERDLRVTNTPDVLNADVADLAMALLFMAAKKVTANSSSTGKSGSGFWAGGLAGKRLGIFGLGRIGKEIARRAEAAGMKISYTNRRPAEGPYTFVPKLEDLARNNDALIIAASGGPETRHIVNREVLRALGPDGILVNVGRGSVVDQSALIGALLAGTIAGAGLDVFEREPDVDKALFDIPTVVMTPHIGSATVETRVEMGQLAIANLNAYFSGSPLLSEVPQTRERHHG